MVAYLFGSFFHPYVLDSMDLCDGFIKTMVGHSGTHDFMLGFMSFFDHDPDLYTVVFTCILICMDVLCVYVYPLMYTVADFNGKRMMSKPGNRPRSFDARTVGVADALSNHSTSTSSLSWASISPNSQA